MYNFPDILNVSAEILKENENCKILRGDVKFIQRFYAGFMKHPNYYSGILTVSTGILKKNVYLVRNICSIV